MSLFKNKTLLITGWFLSMNNYEKDLIRQPLRKVFRRKK